MAESLERFLRNTHNTAITCNLNICNLLPWYVWLCTVQLDWSQK